MREGKRDESRKSGDRPHQTHCRAPDLHHDGNDHSSSGAYLFLNTDEQNWLARRENVIRIGYQDDFLAFCASDEASELTGALKDYLEHASSCFKNARLEFEPVAYPTAGAAMEALKSGEIDCMFPSNLSTTDGETLGLTMTPAMMSSDIYAVVRDADRDAFVGKEQVTAAIEENDPNYDAVLLDHFPDWKKIICPDMEACFKAVSDGSADCALISNYQYNSLSGLFDRYGLTMLATGEDVDFYFAVNRNDNELYSILTRTTNLVSDTTINAALNYYSTEENTVTLGEFIRHNPAIVSAVLIAALALIAIILIQRRLIVAQKTAKKSQQQVEDLNKQVFVDALTHVRNKGGFNNHIQELQDRIDQGETLKVAIGMFDCDELKKANDQYGHDKGNVYLQASSGLICRVFQHSPVFRVGGDEFAAVLMGEDYEKRDELLRRFEEEQRAIRASARNPWERISVASGLAVYDPQRDYSMKDLTRRADQLMYENKHLRKQGEKSL